MAHRRSLRAAALALVGGLAAAALTGQSGAVAQPESPSGTTTRSTAAAGPVLRVYNNNMENLVTNQPFGACVKVSVAEHLQSMLVDDNGQTATAGVVRPDLLLLQQVRGQSQVDKYIEQMEAYLNVAPGTYKGLVAWSDPEDWGANHLCDIDPTLGDLKKKQTNAIIYDTTKLTYVAGSKTEWSAGRVAGGDAANYAGGAGCRIYRPSTWGASYEGNFKWKRTTAVGAKFVYTPTGATVGVASMHLPTENDVAPCAGDGNVGIGGSGIGFGATASNNLLSSDIRVIGMDANRKSFSATKLDGIKSDVLASSYGVIARGGQSTYTPINGGESSKIDYLFVNGNVLPSPIDSTIQSTKSNHKALYAFIAP